MHLLEAGEVFAVQRLSRREDAEAVAGLPTQARELAVHVLEPFDVVRSKNRSHGVRLARERRVAD
jgi:hypothetical protein